MTLGELLMHRHGLVGDLLIDYSQRGSSFSEKLNITQYPLTDNATLTSRPCRWFRQLAACELHDIQAIEDRTIRTQTPVLKVILGGGEHCSVVR